MAATIGPLLQAELSEPLRMSMGVPFANPLLAKEVLLCTSLDNQNPRFAGILKPSDGLEPSTPPYHAIQTATPGGGWQQFPAGSSHFGADGHPNLCHPLRPSVP